jgi:hypothetical protein
MCSAKRHVRFTPESGPNPLHAGLLDGADAISAAGGSPADVGHDVSRLRIVSPNVAGAVGLGREPRGILQCRSAWQRTGPRHRGSGACTFRRRRLCVACARARVFARRSSQPALPGSVGVLRLSQHQRSWRPAFCCWLSTRECRQPSAAVSNKR